jgi:head-tail adaptor
LGSVALPEPINLRERIRFRRALKGALPRHRRRLANCVAPDDRRKALAAIHARIANPTEAEEQDVRIEMARADVAFWERFRDESSADSMSNQTRRRMIAMLERQLPDGLKAIAERHIADAQQRFLALTRGERVDGDGDAQDRKAALALRAAQLRTMMGNKRLV